ncbi:MAG: hypothetical protein IV108_13200 [Burkholderiales bacterium]|nr:hypothetical protein [Burkholderiales bacterium]
MSDDVFDKLDALLKKHAANEPEIPVLTDLVEPPSVDLNAIPVLTEEIAADPFATPLAVELDLIPEPIHIDPVLKQVETEAVLARLDAMEAEVQAEVDARIAQVQTEPASAATTPEPHPEFSIEIPPDAVYVALPQTEIEEAAPVVAPAAPPPVMSPTLSDETLQRIAALIETDVARILKESLHQTLSEELGGILNLTLDKALSSMLDQHMMMLEETVRSTIADEFKKQLAPFKRPPPPNKS